MSSWTYSYLEHTRISNTSKNLINKYTIYKSCELLLLEYLHKTGRIEVPS